MFPILFHVGKINIYSHGVMMVLGIALGGILAYRLAKIRRLDTSFLLDLIVWSALFGIIGARLLYILLYPDQFNSLESYFAIWSGGLVSFGGMVGGLTAAFIFLRRKAQPILSWFDTGVIGMLAGWAIGRIGCFLDGDDLGLVTNSRFAIWHRWPTPLFESGLIVIIVLILSYIFIKLYKKIPAGLVFTIGIGLYATARFIVDFTKEEPVILGPLKYGQVGSIIFFIAAAIFTIIVIKKGKNGFRKKY